MALSPMAANSHPPGTQQPDSPFHIPNPQRRGSLARCESAETSWDKESPEEGEEQAGKPSRSTLYCHCTEVICLWDGIWPPLG